jgi:hypothetical protein
MKNETNEQLKQIRESIGSSFEIINNALGGSEIAPLRFSLCDLGKRCSEKWIYAQGYEPIDTKRMNFLSTFKLWLGAFILSGNRIGAELIINDIEIFIRLCRESVKTPELSTPRQKKNISNIIVRILSDARSLQEALA